MEKFTYSEIEAYLTNRKLGENTKQPYRSVLESFKFLVSTQRLQNESVDIIYADFIKGKSTKFALFAKSVIYNFCQDLEQNKQNSTQQQNTTIKTNHESNTITTTTTTKTTIVKEITLEESKKAFKFSLLAIQKEIRVQQKDSQLNKAVSFYIREPKQLLGCYGYLSEKILLDTISTRFNKKASDVEKVKGIISKIIPNPSGKKFLNLPKKGEFLKYILENNAKIISKDDIIRENPLIARSSLNVEKAIPKKDPMYHWLKDERDIICTMLLLNENLWITGSAGIGKSTMLLQFAYEEQIPLVRTGCNYEADPNDSFFKQSFNGSGVEYILLATGKSFYFANLIGACIDVKEELNSCNEATMIALHSATDDIKSLDTDIGKIELSQNCKCLIVGTGNIGYKGTNDLTPALQSRLIPMEKNEPSDQFILDYIWN